MAKFYNFKYQDLKKFSDEAFIRFGFSEKEAEIITDVLLTSDLYGIDSHGLQRLSRYHKSIESGMIDIKAKSEIVSETPVSAVIEGNSGMGQVISHAAMSLAIEKAKAVGMAIVTVRNAFPYHILTAV